VSSVAARCPQLECGAEFEIEVYLVSQDWHRYRGVSPEHLVAVVPKVCSNGHVLDEKARDRLRNGALAYRHCVVCEELILPGQESFEVPFGRCHEGRCRSDFNAMMVEQECGNDPLPEPHVAEWPADAYKPWIR
jgi:hypothetical protein